MSSDSTRVSIHEAPVRTVLNLRGCPAVAAFASLVNEATGLALPAPDRFNAHGARLLAWLGPDEFLLIDGDDDRSGGRGVEQALRERLPIATTALTCVSAGFTMLQVRGDQARDFLARGWALDLHPRAFDIGQCAQSYLAKAPALLLHRGAGPEFEVIVRRSYAGYLRAWLMATAAAL